VALAVTKPKQAAASFAADRFEPFRRRKELGFRIQAPFEISTKTRELRPRHISNASMKAPSD
jgi:hypothetical protein